MRRILAGMLWAFALISGIAAAQTTPDTVPAGLTGQSQSMGLANVDDHMGKSVIGSDGVRFGVAEDVIFGPDGQAQQLVVATGGMPDIEGKQVAIGMSQVRTRSDSHALHIAGMTVADVAALPEFVLDEDMTSLRRSRQRGAVPGDGAAR